MDIIKAMNLKKYYTSDTYEVRALDGVSLTVEDGEFIAVVGTSGCGKTTITRLLNGLIPHFYEGNLTGTICIDGKEINDQPLYETALLSGTVFQNPRSQFFNVDTTSELAFGLENRGMEETQILKKVDKTVQELQLEKLMNRSIFDLSGGEKQKIACGCVSVCSPNIIILDEPSANLDLKSMEQLHVMIEKWKVEHKTVVIAEHRLAYIWNLIDRMVFLKEGKIEFDFSKEEMQKLTPRDLHQMGLRSNQDVKMVHYNRNENIDRIVFKNFVFGYEKNHNILNLKIMEIDKNSITAIVGNNGIGKSTFLRCICGLERKCKGIMEIDGKVYKRKERLNEIFLVMQDVNHQVSKALVENNPKHTLFVLEDLSGVRNATERVRTKDRYVSVSWSFYDLEQKLIYKAKQNQSTVIKVNPRYTSQCCPVCGHIEKANRNKKLHLFACKNCGYKSNDDRIGAMNLYRMGIDYLADSQVPNTVVTE